MNKFDPKNFGLTLKAARENKSLSQEQVGNVAGSSFQSVGQWERGAALPVAKKIPDICTFLDVTPNKLFGFNETKQNNQETNSPDQHYITNENVSAQTLIDILLSLDDSNANHSELLIGIKTMISLASKKIDMDSGVRFCRRIQLQDRRRPASPLRGASRRKQPTAKVVKIHKNRTP